MKALALLSLLPAAALAADKKEPPASLQGVHAPIYVSYLKTGRETEDEALRLGATEVENSNPCVLKMRRDVQALEKRKEMAEAIAAVSSGFEQPKPKPRLVLRYIHESMELRFELWSTQVRNSDGSDGPEPQKKYEKGVYVTNRPGSWQERLDGEACHVSEATFMGLIDQLREADRLSACMRRKRDLLDSSKKVSNYVHNYLPVAWLAEARRRLVLQNAPVGDLLREDTAVYRAGNTSFKECQRGLRLLEEEAASSVRVLNEVRDTRKGTDVPEKDIEELERMLSGLAK
jgi:hypothetical protein